MDCEDRFPPLFEFAEILQLLLDVADLDFVQVAGDLLAVARDEGHRGALVEQADHRHQPFQRDIQQLRNMNEYFRRHFF